MRLELYCPACGIREFDFTSYRSAVMLAPNLALMRFTCPSCQTPLHVSIKLSRAQQELLRSQQHATASRRASRGKASAG
ncbi:MAG: CpXC domain-containing protein, partial [Coriobacteriia bacterium]|nr:CpXC domain-containing protein [Coriobacteriia bacterium]